MINRLLAWFKNTPEGETDTSGHTKATRAAAALMVEVAIADHTLSEAEEAALPGLLRQYADLNTEEAIELIQLAQDDVEDAIALHEFTRHLNEEFNLDEKLELITVLWRMAYADQDIDKYEEHIIRRIADLLHLRHSEYMQCKHRVLN